MFKVNRKVEYALISLKYMAVYRPDALVTAKEVSETFDIPFDTTSRVMQVMAMNGLLHSVQGARGGYRLNGNVAERSFYELLEMVIGRTEVATCLCHLERSQPHGKGCDFVEQCNIIPAVSVLNEKIKTLFQSVRIGELIVASHRNEWRIKSQADRGQSIVSTTNGQFSV